MNWLIVAAYLVVAVLMMRQFGRRFAAWMIARNRERNYSYDFYNIDKVYTIIVAIVAGALFPVAILPAILMFLVRYFRVSEWLVPQIGERRRIMEQADAFEDTARQQISLGDGVDDDGLAAALYLYADENKKRAVELRKSLEKAWK